MGKVPCLWTIGSGTYQFTWNISPAPSGLVAVPGNNQVGLVWNSAVGATAYNVKRAGVSGGPYAIIAGSIAGTNYTDRAVTNGGTYYYVVSAVAATVESANSFAVSATPEFVFNFGFETPKVSAYAYNPAGAAWTFTAQADKNGSGITANGSLFNSSNPNAPEGVQVAFLQSTSTIAQAISGFIPGAKYAVTFSAAERAGQYQNGGQTWNLKLDNLILASYRPAAAAHKLCGLHHKFYRDRCDSYAVFHRHGFAGRRQHRLSRQRAHHTRAVADARTAWLAIHEPPARQPVPAHLAGGPHRLASANADQQSGHQLGQRDERGLCQRALAADDKRPRVFPSGLSLIRYSAMAG